MDVIYYSVGLLGIIIVLAVVVFIIRKLLFREPETSENFTLADLRRLHREGQLSDEEYETAKIALIGPMVQSTTAPQTAGGESTIDHLNPPDTDLTDSKSDNPRNPGNEDSRSESFEGNDSDSPDDAKKSP